MSHPSEHDKRESIEELQQRIEETKRKLQEDEARLEREERELGRLEAGGEHQQKEFHYFVDGVEYSTKSSTLTGAEVKANIKDFNPAYGLYLEGGGTNPDKLFTDTDALSLLDCEEPHFITVPPATFGK